MTGLPPGSAPEPTSTRRSEKVPSSRSRAGVVWLWLRKIGLLAVSVLVVEYVVVPQLVHARSDLTLFADASSGKLLLALALEVASLASYTALTRVVLPQAVRTRFVDQLRIDLTGLGFSHVVPGGGASAAALRFRLMTDWGIPADDAASTTAVQTVVAVIGLVATFTGGVVLALPGIESSPAYTIAGGVALAALVAASLGMRMLSRRPAAQGRPGRLAPRALPSRPAGPLGRVYPWAVARVRALADTAEGTARRAAALIRDPRRRAAAFGCAGGNWLLDAASLWVCLWAYGIRIHPGVLLAAYGASNLLGMLPITPGGLGVVEGVLVPALTTPCSSSGFPCPSPA